MDAYVQSQQKSMEHYLEDQYQIASAARVATVPTGEVVMVCCEDSDTVFENIKKGSGRITYRRKKPPLPAGNGGLCCIC